MTADLSLVLDPLQDGKSKIQLIDYMGGDLAIVNSARSSFNKHSEFLEERDIKLINYLIRERHYSPLRNTVFTFKVKAPLFLCRQIWKHVVASSHIEEQIQHNEASARYIEMSEEFYIPSTFRQQSTSNRQATVGALEPEANQKAIEFYTEACQNSYASYQYLLELGVGREQARGVLVPATYTTWVWCSSLQAILHFIDLRKGKGSQTEIQVYAEAVKNLIEPIVPHTLFSWSNYSAD